MIFEGYQPARRLLAYPCSCIHIRARMTEQAPAGRIDPAAASSAVTTGAVSPAQSPRSSASAGEFGCVEHRCTACM